MKNRFKLNNFCSILFNKIFTSDVLCKKKCPKNKHFSNVDFPPLSLLVKSKISKKRKPMCTTAMPMVFKFILFDSLALALSEPKPVKSFQRAINRDRKLIRNSFCID